MGAKSELPARALNRLGILGAGRAGTALARVAAQAGIEVNIAASRPPRMLKYHLMQYAPQAVAVTAQDIAKNADAVILMIPQEELGQINPDTLRGIILVDATNRWEDEELPNWFEAALAAGLSSSEAIAQRFDSARVVKALNHISHWDMDSFARHSANPRRALGVASDHDADALLVAELIERLGYEAVLLESLAAGAVLEPGSPIFNEQLSAAELRQAL